ncbi:alpha/beta hydrolase family protein [Nocardioides daeguensis]|uniref:Peptidase S9 prolyl oligopeptidase catalytic domain-containing protein n=1 Tax=Nocardioides daeguensis TaxID=908359 RepID=A0ABP6VM79_9ACTN|nr:alpha/beta fold hydrolase [Nocardioides daeguensis]MBV6727532.1 prolyl oligopeptidase family serine peptidase [Nocardioides daeguensis]MCR1773246.1 prolyl oligopeptidase family serine peptidase [Nocardioides daeguensis]
MTPLPLHDALVELAYPASLTLDQDGRRLALIGVGADPEVHLLDPTLPGGAATTWPLSAEPTLVRWSVGSAELWVVTLGEHGEPTRLSLLAPDGSTIATTQLAGAIEDLVPLGPGSALLRVADVGSERDGMHLGLRVRGTDPDDPEVRRGDALPLRRLVHVAVADGAVHHAAIDLGRWSAWDVHAVGERAVVVASQDPAPAGYYRPTLLLVDGLTSERATVRELYRTDGQLARPRLAPTGDRVAVIEGQSIVSGVVHVHDLPTGAWRTVADLDDATDVGWLDEDRLWFAGWEDLGVQVGRIAVPGPGEAATVTGRWTHLASMHGDAGQPALAVAPDGATAYTVWEEPGQPPEVVSLCLDEPGTTRLTDHNATLRKEAPEVLTERATWTSPDGTEVHGLVLRPAAASGPLPLVLLLHGGPTWLWSASFAPAESNQLALPLAAAGAVVLLPNPRGSSGRGQAYATQVRGDTGGADLADVLAGADHLVERGLADPDRTAVMGLSYGGYLSAQAAVTQPRFRAAVVMSGVSDWLGFVTTSAIGGGYDAVYHPAGDLGSAAGRDALVGPSPLYRVTSSAVPTLFLHGALDRITPLAQAEQLFGELARLGVPSELVVYPREGHELIEPEHRRDAAARVASWLRDHGVLDGTED